VQSRTPQPTGSGPGPPPPAPTHRQPRLQLAPVKWDDTQTQLHFQTSDEVEQGHGVVAPLRLSDILAPPRHRGVTGSTCPRASSSAHVASPLRTAARWCW
jgi:hypothetical protein